ncbi:hypothetical protein GLU26_02150 [Nanohaloarchaea archaeon]|nr:hypothetical protein [Candidatus Nanohaloarchaea archaeon]
MFHTMVYMAFTKTGKMVENFDSIQSKDEIDVIKIKNTRIEDSSLNTSNLAIILAFKDDVLYLRHRKNNSIRGGGPEHGHLKIEPDMIDWQELYLSEEEDKAKNNMMTGAAYWGTGNAMQSFDYSQLYIELPFDNPETGEDERIKFKLKKDKRMKKMQRFLEKNKKRAEAEKSEEESSEHSPLEILKKKFAKGEISEEEFKKKKNLLQE